MDFDTFGPSIDIQDIRNVTKGRLGTGAATLEELIEGAHYSQDSLVPQQGKGYEERYYGYGAVSYDWTDWRADPSPRFNTRFSDLFEAVGSGNPVLVFMYLDFPPTFDPDPPDPNDPPDPEDPPRPPVTLDELAALEKVWRLVVGYSINSDRIYVHDPLPQGTGALGGENRGLSISEFDALWNVTMADGAAFRTHRIGMCAMPWTIELFVDDEKYDNKLKVEAGTQFTLNANITYKAPPVMLGEAVSDPVASLDLPPDFEVVGSGPERDLAMTGPRSYSRVSWVIDTPDKSFVDQDVRFILNASGVVRGESRTYRDRIGQSLRFDIPVYGFLNHPPAITSASITPREIPDDGTVQPLITCRVEDEDGNLKRGGVTADLSELIGSSYSGQVLYDDGSHGDLLAEDNIYSYSVTQDPRSAGEKRIVITAEDNRGATAVSNLTITVRTALEWYEAPEFADKGMYPYRVPNDGFTQATIWARVEDPEDDVKYVEADLTPVGGDNKQRLYDDGTSGDLFSDDGNYSFSFVITPLVELGEYQIPLRAGDVSGHEVTDHTWVKVILPAVPPIIVDARAEPSTIINDGVSVCEISAQVEDDNEDIVSVFADLERLGGARSAPMYDDGTHGDIRADDDVWTLTFTVPADVLAGSKKVDIIAEDSTGLQAEETLNLYVEQANLPPSIEEYGLEPDSGRPGDTITVTANVSDPEDQILSVTLTLEGSDGTVVEMLDDGTEGDLNSGDGTYTCTFTIPEGAPEGRFNLTIGVLDSGGGTDSVVTSIEVLGPEDEVEILGGEMAYVYLSVGAVVVLLLVFLFGMYRKKTKAPNRGAQEGRFRPVRGPPPVSQGIR